MGWQNNRSNQVEVPVFFARERVEPNLQWDDYSRRGYTVSAPENLESA